MSECDCAQQQHISLMLHHRRLSMHALPHFRLSLFPASPSLSLSHFFPNHHHHSHPQDLKGINNVKLGGLTEDLLLKSMRSHDAREFWWLAGWLVVGVLLCMRCARVVDLMLVACACRGHTWVPSVSPIRCPHVA